jgi:integrase
MNVRCAFHQVYVERVRLSHHTIKTAVSHVARWEACGDDPDVENITPETFDRFRAAATIRYSPDTIEGTVRFVMQVLRLLHNLGYLDRVPWPGKPLRIRRQPKYVPPLADLGKLYAAAAVAQWPIHMPAADYWRAVLALGYFTGLRLGDLRSSLKWENVGPEMITVEASKTQKLHVYPSHSVVRRVLASLPERGSLVLSTPKSNHQFLRELHRMNDAAGLSRHITCQTIRRLSATQWQAAKWGAGECIQGSAIRGSARLYIVPRILLDAVDSLAWPEEMLTAQERDSERANTLRLLRVWKRLNAEGRNAVQALAERLAG